MRSRQTETRVEVSARKLSARWIYTRPITVTSRPLQFLSAYHFLRLLLLSPPHLALFSFRVFNIPTGSIHFPMPCANTPSPARIADTLALDTPQSQLDACRAQLLIMMRILADNQTERHMERAEIARDRQQLHIERIQLHREQQQLATDKEMLRAKENVLLELIQLAESKR